MAPACEEGGNFKESLPYKAQLLARALQIDYLTRIAATGIAPAQAYALGELWLEEPLSQVELARRLDIGKATVGKTLNRLEAAGLIERNRVEHDRRLILIRLTERGRALREPLMAGSDAQCASLAAILGASDFAQFDGMVDRLLTAIRQETN